MNLKILLFGAAAEAAKNRDLSYSVGQDITVGELIEILRRDYPPLDSLQLLSAVNQEYAEAERRLNDGDEVALFTPVSGG
ncbi:MAG: molybdopterin synthase sulfur carrier subunit [Blastocatellia bacterium]